MKCHSQKKFIEEDIKRWSKCLNLDKGHTTYHFNSLFYFINLMTFYPEFRNLFYYRLGWFSRTLYFFCRPMSTLYIRTKSIGPGLFIQHGFATIISAEKIGRNCWINQQVTIGYSNDTDCPVIGDNVAIYAGAKIVGKVKIGNNSVIGANTVVTKDVPDNCVVVGRSSYILRRNGDKVKEQLS
jgi:serine O-acetyltransferase